MWGTMNHDRCNGATTIGSIKIICEFVFSSAPEIILIKN
jgi:hypothetical protein